MAFFWGVLAVWASTRLYGAVQERLESPDLEDDVLVFTPIFVQESYGKGVEAVLRFVFHLADDYGVPSLNAWWYLMQRWFGLEVKSYSLFLLALHHLNALLFWVLLARGLRMGIAAASFAAILFLVYSPQFHAYIWPVAFQHLSALTGVFLTLILYRETEKRVAEGTPRALRWQEATMAVAAFSSFSRFTILLAPFHILLDIFSTSGSAEEVQRRIRRWIPLFLVYLPFRIVSLIRDAEGQGIFLRLPGFGWGVPPWVIGLLLLSAGAGTLWLLARLIVPAVDAASLARRWLLARWTPMITFLAGGAFVLWLLQCIAPWILGFKLCWIPGASLYKTLLYDRWQVVTLPVVLQGGPTWAETGSIFALLVFAYVCLRGFRDRLPFLGWYLVAYFGVRRFGIQIPSRYYLYLSPLVAICVATLVVDGCAWLLHTRNRWAIRACRAAVAVTAVFLVVAHTGATRKRTALSQLPGVVTHYDYVRAAHAIRDDLISHPEKAGRPLHVRGVRHAWFFIQNHQKIAPVWDVETYHPFKYVLGAVLHWPIARATQIRVNGPCEEGEICYTLARNGVYSTEGRNLDLFCRYYEEGMRLLAAGEDQTALAALEEAVQAKPFFFRHLGRGGPPEEFTAPSGRTLFDLFHQLRRWINPDREFRFGMVMGEHLDHLRALATIAYLQQKEGLAGQAKRTFTTLRLHVSRKGEAVHPLYWGDVQRIVEGIRDPRARVRVRDFLIEEGRVNALPPWVVRGKMEE